MNFELCSFVDFAPGRPSLLVPIFSQQGSNAPFAQTMDEFYFVTNMTPFYSFEEYTNVAPTERRIIAVGDAGLIGLRTHDMKVKTCTVEEIYRYWEQYESCLDSLPLLKAQLMRIVVSTDIKASLYSMFREVGKRYFSTQDQVRFWLEIEASFLPKAEKFWREQRNPISQKEKLLSDELGSDFDVERLVGFLSLSSYYDLSDWSKYWFVLLSLSPSDERVIYLAQQWLYYLFADTERTVDGRSVFCAVVDQIYVGYGIDEQFEEFLRDLVSESTIFGSPLDLPDKTIRRCLEILEVIMDQGDFARLMLGVLAENYLPRSIAERIVPRVVSKLEGPESISEDLREQLLDNIIPKLRLYDDDASISLSIRQLKMLAR
ncbi:MAG: hypothetical protein Q8M31_06865 [Beijerinckiaceae bacterium]|nr:hypothetical protein [Beijerinckiaceae bacterium]